MTRIWALFLCGCGFMEIVRVRIDERVHVAHDCPLALK